MASKVIHLSDAVHALIKDYCTQNGYSMSEWAGKTLQEAVERGSMGKKKPTGVVVPVEKKKVKQTTGESVDDGPKPWEREPFWKRRGEPGSDTNRETEEKTPTTPPEAQQGKAQRFDELAGDGQGA